MMQAQPDCCATRLRIPICRRSGTSVRKRIVERITLEERTPGAPHVVEKRVIIENAGAETA